MDMDNDTAMETGGGYFPMSGRGFDYDSEEEEDEVLVREPLRRVGDKSKEHPTGDVVEVNLKGKPTKPVFFGAMVDDVWGAFAGHKKN